MAFQKQRFVRQTVAYNAGQITTSNNPSVTPILENGPAFFSYASELDDIATMLAPNYFLEVIYDLSVNDIIVAVGSDTSAFLQVETVDRDAGTITTISFPGAGGNATVQLPTITNHLIVALDVDGLLGNLSGTALHDGDLQLGKNNIPGALISYPTGLNKGFLTLAASQNAGAFNTIITNSSQAQNSTYTIPDSGVASPSTSNFLISNFPGIQHIETGDLQIDAGEIVIVGTGLRTTTPIPTTGSLNILPTNNGDDFDTTISNGPMLQSTNYTIPDIEQASGGFVVSKLPTRIHTDTQNTPGGNASLTFTDAFCTSLSIVIGVWKTTTNAVAIQKITPGSGSFDVISSADPGNSDFGYMIIK